MFVFNFFLNLKMFSNIPRACEVGNQYKFLIFFLFCFYFWEWDVKYMDGPRWTRLLAHRQGMLELLLSVVSPYVPTVRLGRPRHASNACLRVWSKSVVVWLFKVPFCSRFWIKSSFTTKFSKSFKPSKINQSKKIIHEILSTCLTIMRQVALDFF